MVAGIVAESGFVPSSYKGRPWEEEDPELAWMKAQQLLRHLQGIPAGSATDILLKDHVQHSVSCAIYFSNRIEEVGLPLTETMCLVRNVLQGTTLPEHELDDVPVARQSRREVLQHAAAFVFLRDRMVLEQQLLSKALICEAHRILMTGMLREDGLAVQAGAFCTTPVYAGHHQFPPSECISRSIAYLVGDYHERAAEDPFVLAAWLSHEFVSIHPFEDGNGRICRLLLNMALLSRGVPFCSALGFSSGHRQAMKHYMQCVKHARSSGGHPRKLAFVVLCGFRDTATSFLEAVRIAIPG